MTHLYPRCLDRPLGHHRVHHQVHHQVHQRSYSFEDGPAVYPANAFDSRLQGN